MSVPSAANYDKAFTGIAGLDEILNGGFPRNYMYIGFQPRGGTHP